MISLLPLIQYLEPKPADFPHLWFRKVDGAAEFAQIRPDALPLPMAWVVRAAEREDDVGERASDLGLVFDVVIAIENVRSHYPGEMDEILLQYRQAVRKRLQGWRIEADVKPIKFKGGQVLEYTDGDLYWRDRYSFDALITNYLPDPVSFEQVVHTGASL